MILPEGLTPGGFPADGAWRFADILDPDTECFTGNTGGEPVPTEDVCYYDEGEVEGDEQVWWLSKRTANFWKAFSLAVNPTEHVGPVEVTAVDVGDLLESSPDLNLRRIRTEVTLYQDAMLDDYFAAFVPTSYPVDFTGGTPAAPCQLPTTAGQSVGCFAAFEMSGAVPGTEESINELQGTNFGFDADGEAHETATGALIDPTLVRFDADTEPPTGFHATVYSRCARLIIQKLTSGTPVWDPVSGYWGSGANAPVVNIAAYNNEYSSEVNSSGTLIYGFNWDASRLNEGTGTYRLTYVLDGLPRCDLNAEFTDATLVANAGDIRPATLESSDDLNTGVEGDPVYGGLVYVDVPISAKGGGGGGGRGIGGGVGGGNPNR